MHQIQKLELVGFKSFCDRTRIVFNEGTTAIVGPNGCGKSNIADAISWVVGEQSAKSLRTDRMEGVIFNGTQARRATSFAEVILSLSLKDHFNVSEGLDLNPEGFTVGRRLYRTGESEYYLDGKRCRLKDIQALFEGTGLGPNSYALIEQGRIGQILSSKPADRRALIEEAARITLFKSRRYSAEMKLEMAQQNLLRVNDIIREVVRQLNSLRRQAAKARRYARLREELRSVHRLRLGMEWRDLLGKMEQCASRFASAQAREQEILAQLAVAEESRTASQQALRAKEERLNEARDALAQLRVDIGNAQSLSQNQAARRQGLEERRLELEREQRAIAERGMIVQREQERLTASSAALAEEIAQDQEVLDREQSRSEAIQDAIRQAEGSIDGLRSFLLNGAARLAEFHNLQTRCEENLARIGARMSRLAGEREETARQRGAMLDRLAEWKRQLEACNSRRQEVARHHTELERRAAESAQRLEQVAAEMDAQHEEYSLMQHRFTSLEEVEQRRSNYSEGVQKFLSTQLAGEELRPAQTLADHIETDPAYEAAIEDYLNDPLQYILVDGLEDAVRNVERVKRIGAGKCTFMTLHNGHPPAPAASRAQPSGEGIVGYLGQLLKMRDDVKQAFERALPELASTLMVSDLSTAFRVAETHAESNFLTLAGEAYSPRGTLSAVGERKSMAGFLALKREKRELEAKLALLRDKIQATREELARLKGEQSSVADSIKELMDESRRLEVDGVGLQHQVATLESEIQKLVQFEDVAAGELSQLLQEKIDFETRLREAAEGIREVEERSHTGSEELQRLSTRLESLRSENAALSRGLAGLISAHAVKQERKSGFDSSLVRLAGEADEVCRRSEANEAERSMTVARISALEDELKETEARIERCRLRIDESESGLASRQMELAEQRDALATLEELLRRLHLEREQAMEARGRIEIEKTRLESDLEHLARNCQDEFHLLPLELVAQIQDADWQRDASEVSRLYDGLRDRVENFGAINMRALEEYQELDQRYQFLNQQRADIEQSIADTQKAIAEINRRSVEQFQDAFDGIRRHFIEVFQILFKGGQCDLRLMDEGDVLESGIDIIAQPPGKRLQNVLLLSGGEKALTALAILIAIFRYRPSPFCVLDEVDAPLDDANIVRFTQLVTELSNETQFIIITHNKKTMEVADTLYGVTMEEPGVSKIVGVDLRPAQEALAS